MKDHLLLFCFYREHILDKKIIFPNICAVLMLELFRKKIHISPAVSHESDNCF